MRVMYAGEKTKKKEVTHKDTQTDVSQVGLWG